ncbi:flagellar motor protein MotB [Sansalvadorimonas verongulae]|uniref:flagellar motor protein MotB n=1 Tax=Sansalvadorimonas verongulae TaxID=2172824 RepID=UPI0012BD613F|nr:flagellar motor protein MotB [Sansalvadorimonas verongulae]MTI13263.1 hypothetical protein [Sansalvadorimonas verongulae]
MAKDKTPIIVVRKSRKGHGGHHGGSWKVAIADFAIAMMALFLVLWLLSVTDDEQKAAIAAYFEDPGTFMKTGSAHPIDLGGSPNIMRRVDKVGPSMKGQEGTEVIGDLQAPQRGEKVDFEDLIKQLNQMLSGDMDDRHLDEYVFMEVLPEGLRLVILDRDEDHMFERGSSRLNPFYEDLLLALARLLKTISNPILVSGHSDATKSRSSSYNKWRLSGERAMVAQRVLLFGGVSDDQFIMVSALADHEPRIPNNPEDGSNRRVELMVLNHNMSTRIRRLFAPVDHQGLPKENLIPQEQVDKVEQEAHSNQLPKILRPE